MTYKSANNQDIQEFTFYRDVESVRDMFENMLYGFAYHKVVYNLEGKPFDYIFLQLNSAFEKLTGLKRANIIGKSVLEVLPNTESYWIETYCRVALTGITEKFENYSLELGKWYEVTVCSTKKDYFGVIFNDITERKLHEMEVTESEDCLRCIIEHSQDAFYRRNNVNNNYDYLSPVIEKIIGYTVDEMKLMTMDMVMEKIHPEDLPDVIKAINEASLSSKVPMEIEYRFLCKEGSYRWLSDSFTSMTENAEKQSFLYGVVKDITERKLSEEEIKVCENEIAQLDRLRTVGELAATLAHEIRNPMTVVMGYTQLISQNMEGKSLERFKLIIDELKNVNLIIEDFLSLARNQGIEMKEHQLNDLISNEYQLIYAESVRKGIKVVLELSEDLPMIQIDRKEIKQVILNIVKNAIEVMDYSGILKISTWPENLTKEVILSISDTGGGIAEENLDKIFNPFYTTKEYGTGLGLGVCKAIIQRHNGSITVKSKVDIGTTFEIAFPSIERKDYQ